MTVKYVSEVLEKMYEKKILHSIWYEKIPPYNCILILLFYVVQRHVGSGSHTRRCI